MVTVSHIVKKIVSQNPFLQEAMSKGIISHGNLAEEIKREIEAELGKKVKEPAIIMALRRHEEELHGFDIKSKKFRFSGEILMRTNIIDFNILKSPSLLSKIKNIYNIVNFEKGDSLNVILGNNEVSIVINDKFEKKISEFLRREKIIHKENGLVSISIIFKAGGFISTPGVIFTAVRKLAWEQINIYEIVSTNTELTFILRKKDSMRAYEVLSGLVGTA